MVKLSWAHPEFGHVLASASFDRTVKVWEQTAGASDPPAAGAGAGAPATRWVERAALLDARGTVRGVEFAPHHFGLKLVRPRFPRLPQLERVTLTGRAGGRRRSAQTTSCACTSASSRPRSRRGSSPKKSTCPRSPVPHPQA